MFAENNCAEVALNKQRCLLRGYWFLGGHGKAGGQSFFFCEKYWGLNLKKNRKLLGGCTILLKFVFNDNPHANYQRYAQSTMGVALLVYDNAVSCNF